MRRGEHERPIVYLPSTSARKCNKKNNSNRQFFAMSVTDASVKSCYILRLDKSSSNIFLPDNEPIFVGRSPESGITDTQCSRKQGCVSLKHISFLHQYYNLKIKIWSIQIVNSSLIYAKYIIIW